MLSRQCQETVYRSVSGNGDGARALVQHKVAVASGRAKRLWRGTNRAFLQL